MSLYDKEAEHCPILISAAAFWDFSLNTYAEPAVKDACLAAQDDFGADVNLLLLCLWLGRHQCAPDPKAWQGLLAASAEWQQEKLGPLRARRRALKGQAHYALALADELAAEKEAQVALIAVLEPDSLPAATPLAALDTYARHLGLPAAIVKSLSSAACPV